MKFIACFLITSFLFSQCRYKEDQFNFSFPGKPLVPSIIQGQHDSLLERLSAISSFQDSTGKTATKLRELLVHHFNEEEEFVLPVLGLLPLLADGNMPEEPGKILELTDRYKANRVHMNAEHQYIKALVSELVTIGSRENHLEPLEFERNIQQHAALEDEVYFPMVILIGDYLRIKQKQSS